MGVERKDEGARALVRGRVEELKRLEAAERALVDAFCEHARTAADGGRLLHLAERHRRIAALLAEQIVALGGEPEYYADDLWIIGPPAKLDTLIYAEQTAIRTYHDHLLDFDGETVQLVRDRILPEHEETLALLTAEHDAAASGLEHGSR